MPRMNGTGPFGRGRPGRGLGPCGWKKSVLPQGQPANETYEQPENMNWWPGRGGWFRGTGPRPRGRCIRFWNKCRRLASRPY